MQKSNLEIFKPDVRTGRMTFQTSLSSQKSMLLCKEFQREAQVGQGGPGQGAHDPRRYHNGLGGPGQSGPGTRGGTQGGPGEPRCETA